MSISRMDCRVLNATLQCAEIQIAGDGMRVNGCKVWMGRGRGGNKLEGKGKG
ncbi:hypothetical protein AN958_06541 [Leucoagaricus sp. SymC.cos]|nr:hypothetical protein AN958_06541 [Leucoagaricus sp. SymC.cos]